MKLTKEDFNTIYISSLFTCGIIFMILGMTLIKNEILTYLGFGLLAGSMAIVIFDYIISRK